MKAFISYSHNDSTMLDVFHKHLAQLKREGLIQTWEDREIAAGGHLDNTINAALERSQIFIALLSPDYIASRYCYEKEFEKAMKMHEEGKLVIVPVIVEACDWQNTPFNKFKALPKDGKAISQWENKNTAFLDVTLNLRRLVSGVSEKEFSPKISNSTTRNYRVQKDFDSIQKLEFVEKTFQEVKDYLKRFQAEIMNLENIKVKVLQDSDKTYECILVNRNKIATESQLTLTTQAQNHPSRIFSTDELSLSYSISKNSRPTERSFNLAYDEYELFWTEGSYYTGWGGKKLSVSKEIADLIWNDWLSSVGIL